MRLQQSKTKRDLKAKWPEGWESEAQRLAKLYMRTSAEDARGAVHSRALCSG